MDVFSEEFHALINNFFGESLAIKVNNDVGRYFQKNKSLRQGDPQYPISFNIVLDMLPIIIERVQVDGQVEGVVHHLVDGGLSIL
jgi:hypothetical protein